MQTVCKNKKKQKKETADVESAFRSRKAKELTSG